MIRIPSLALFCLLFWVPVHGSATVKTSFISNMEHNGFSAQVLNGAVFITPTGDIIYRLEQGSLKEVFINGSVKEVTGKDPAFTQVIRMIGANPKKWKKRIPAFHTLDLGEVYPNINVILKARGFNVEKLYYAAPGADPRRIRMAVKGASQLKLTGSGELEAQTPNGAVMFTKPMAYQKTDAGLKQVKVEYRLYGLEYGFQVHNADPNYELIIDPMLASTFLGGSKADGHFMVGHFDMILDSQGTPYIVAHTESMDFPTSPGAFEETFQGGDLDLVVIKLSKDLSTLISSTYIGGSRDDRSACMAFDENNNLCVVGYTSSLDFPTTPTAYDTTYNGGDSDFFILKLDPSLSTLLGSTYLGGSGDESLYGNGVTVSKSGEILAAGGTESVDFPTTAGAFDTTHNGGQDLFACKLDSHLSILQMCTFIGGSGNEKPREILLDPNGDLLMTGTTGSLDFPTTANAFDKDYNGGYTDVFVLKMDLNLTTLKASTYLGGAPPGGDAVSCLVCDSMGNIYLSGHCGAGFPTTASAYDKTHNGYEGYISKLDNSLSTLLASTFMSGPGPCDVAGGPLVLDKKGDIYVAGNAQSPGFPVHANAYDKSYNGGNMGDGLISIFNNSLTACLGGTYLGGSGFDCCYGICMDEHEDIYVVGLTDSIHFPITPNAYDYDYNGGSTDLFVSKLDKGLSLDPLKVSPKSLKVFPGGKADFKLNAGSQNANRGYLILGSVSGCSPGFYLPKGVGMPLNWDKFTNCVAENLNTVYFTNFVGTLNGNGIANASFYMPPMSGIAGLKMVFAFALNGPWDYASNPVMVQILW